ncbi:MAG: NusA-like transcription termination signal-binding factor [Thaumarchaeota archaeon]|nr:NusA-like transcription termination signal-binding factor [Candidatus Wolframiiraptor allenii]MCL7394112.1 NusA-like transcription termination signal-binding factor [Candidatus Wolframiiraptor allenii]
MSEGIKLTDKEMRYISLLEAATGANIIDCVEHGDMVVFVVGEGELQKIFSSREFRIQDFAKLIKKRVKIVEYSRDPAKFIENALQPAKLLEPVRMAERPDGRKIAVASVDPKYKAMAIGKAGRMIELVRLLAKRHHDVDHVIIR